MKITKSELKTMIREALREELKNRSALTESVDNNYFFMVLIRDVNAYRIDEITMNEAEARKAYDRAITKYKAVLTCLVSHMSSNSIGSLLNSFLNT